MEFVVEREAMVALLRQRQDVSEPVAEALRAVPRHLFVPGVDPNEAYQDGPIVTKRDAEGRPISSSSQPAIMATMLDQLGVRPGHRVLEIGAGTGYNAALLARLAGPEGRVVTVDIDEDLVAGAREHLAAVGESGVEVVCGDGADGHLEAAPYDRLIATVGVWDLAPAWLEQLKPDGRLVVPLDLRGLQVSVAMERADGHWVSRSVAPCGFMRMRGRFAGPEVLTVSRRDPELTLGLPGARDLGDVAAALDTVPTEITTKVEEPSPGPVVGIAMSLWLALHEPRWCMLGSRTAAGPTVTAGIVEGDGIAVLAAEGTLLARGYGAGGARLAAELAGHVAAWDAAGRPQADGLRLAAYPGEIGVESAEGAKGAKGAEGIVIRKRHTTLVLDFG